MKPLEIAVLGCGSRGRTYARIAASFGGRYRLRAAVDPVSVRREAVISLAPADEIRGFEGLDDFLAAGRLADVLVIATQDADHFAHASRALEAGYDLLLEKPAARTLEECEELDRIARRLGRRVALCFVLRYTPFYRSVRRVLDEGLLGRVITIRAAEGVEPFHQAHSFVRGHWGRAADSTPMIVAKCSHDADLLCWLGGAGPREVSSHGSLSWFHEGNAPAGAPARCTDGCPVAASCPYDAHRYLSDKRRWLAMVMDGAESAADPEILAFLRHSPWGRCVYRCDNDVVDHQVLAAELENGVTASLTMTAFDQGRRLEIHGTAASLSGGERPGDPPGEPRLWLRDHATATWREIPLEASTAAEGYAGHGGGDYGLVDALDSLFAGPRALPPGLDGLAGHRLAFRAEQARLQAARAGARTPDAAR